MLSNADKRRIEQQDKARRFARETEELLALMPSRGSTTATDRVDTPNVHINPELIRGCGVVSPPSDARVTRRSAGRAGTKHWYDVTVRDAHKPALCLSALSTRGIAPGTEAISDGTPTVRVTHADGSTEVRTIASYRKNSGDRGSKAATAQARPHKLTAADLAPIGDANH